MAENNIPVLPLRDIVVFPHMVVPLFVGRDKSVKALEKVMAGDKRIMLITQKKHLWMILKRMIYLISEL